MEIDFNYVVELGLGIALGGYLITALWVLLDKYL